MKAQTRASLRRVFANLDDALFHSLNGGLVQEETSSPLELRQLG
jgi:hypothetical protein